MTGSLETPHLLPSSTSSPPSVHRPQTIYLPIHHVRDHHDGVHVGIGELERLLDALDIVGEHPRLTEGLAVGAGGEDGLTSLLTDGIPEGGEGGRG